MVLFRSWLSDAGVTKEEFQELFGNIEQCDNRDFSDVEGRLNRGASCIHSLMNEVTHLWLQYRGPAGGCKALDQLMDKIDTLLCLGVLHLIDVPLKMIPPSLAQLGNLTDFKIRGSSSIPQEMGELMRWVLLTTFEGIEGRIQTPSPERVQYIRATIDLINTRSSPSQVVHQYQNLVVQEDHLRELEKLVKQVLEQLGDLSKQVGETKEKIITNIVERLEVGELLDVLKQEAKKKPEKIMEVAMRNLERMKSDDSQKARFLRELTAALKKRDEYEKLFEKTRREKILAFLKSVGKAILGPLASKAMDELIAVFEPK